MIKVDVDKCVGCGGCIDLCPATAISLVNDKSWINTDLCLECETCIIGTTLKLLNLTRLVCILVESSDILV